MSRLDQFPWDRKCDVILTAVRALSPDADDAETRWLRQVAEQIIDHRDAHPLTDAEREEWLASLAT